MYTALNIVATFQNQDEPLAEQVFRADAPSSAVRADSAKPRRLPMASRPVSAADTVRVTFYRSDIAEDEMTVSMKEWKTCVDAQGFDWMGEVFFRDLSLQAACEKAQAMGRAKTLKEALANIAGGIPVFAL